MKQNKYVYNICVQREKDGKLEVDTLFATQKLTFIDAEKIGKKYNCNVKLDLVGIVVPTRKVQSVEYQNFVFDIKDPKYAELKKELEEEIEEKNKKEIMDNGKKAFL